MGDLRKMLSPRTVALIGATDRPDAIGKTVLKNLMNSGRQVIYPVNPNRDLAFGLTCCPRVQDIDDKVDLAVIVTPPHMVAGHLRDCAEAGVHGAIILSAGFQEIGPEGEEREKELKDIRNRYDIRVLGPNCVGLIRPNIGLNASLLRVKPRAGNIAFISQGNRISDTIVDWQLRAQIGFSLFATLGSMIDIGFGDLIDIVGDDDDTRSIMLYMETVGNARRFLSAARSFARSKPIIVMKSGMFTRHAAPEAPDGMTGWIRCDQVYDAAFKRAGVVRVKEVADLFNVSQVLNSRVLPNGPKLMVITNAADAGIIAMDTLFLLHGELAKLSNETICELDAFLPQYWSRGNPVCISDDASIAMFVRTIEKCIANRETDGVVVVFAPRTNGEEVELAKAMAGLPKHKPILCTILGATNVTDTSDVHVITPVPVYSTPEEAVRTYLYMYKYKRNLELLYETPPERSAQYVSSRPDMKKLILNALSRGSTSLVADEASSLIAAYGIPVLKPVIVKDLGEAREAADRIGYPVFLKVEMSEIPRGEKAHIAWARSPGDLEKAYTRLEGFRGQTKDARGISLRKMLEEIDYQVRAGVRKDPEFGSVMYLGMGGISAGVFSNFAVGLPPLNKILARRLMEETMVFRAVPRPPAAILPSYFGMLEDLIVSLSSLVVDFPEIAEICINPIAVANGKIYSLDARISLDKGYVPMDHPLAQYSHLVISPYPTRYSRTHTLPDGTDVLLRPIRPEDERLYLEMLNSLSRETMIKRFFGLLRNITHDMMARFCNVDYDREMAIVAETGSGDDRRLIGVGTLIIESIHRSGQFAVLVHDDYHGKGLGSTLLKAMVDIGRDKELDEIYGIVLSDNNGMLSFCKKMGFSEKFMSSGTSRVTLDLKKASP